MFGKKKFHISVTFIKRARLAIGKRKVLNVTEFNNIVDQYSDRLFRYVLKTMRDQDGSRDIVQDSFEKLWNRRHQVDLEKAGAWLYRTSYNAVIDFKRKSVRQSFPDEMPEKGEESGYSDLKEVLNKALTTLNEKQRSSVLLRDYEGYSYKEIGEILEMNEGQVKITIYRARIALKEYIGAMDVLI